MSKITFCGCSFTAGIGFAEGDRPKYCFPWLVGDHFGYDVDNKGDRGSPNLDIFHSAVEQVGKTDILVVSWTHLGRMRFQPDYYRNYYFSSSWKDQDIDHIASCIGIPKRHLMVFSEVLSLMLSELKELENIVRYCEILAELGDMLNTKVIFYSIRLPWKREWKTDVQIPRVKEIIGFDAKPDNQIAEVHKHLVDIMDRVDEARWVNPFDRTTTIDFAPLDEHPGIKSHKMMANDIIEYMQRNDI